MVKIAVEPAPSSWGIDQWPAHVWPGSPEKGRYVTRAFRTELVDAGALTRVGRDLVVVGIAYSRWVASKGAAVAGYEIAANRKRA